MSPIWTHPPYAEDQLHSTPILITHVLFRGFQTGAMIGPALGSLRYALPLIRTTSPARASLVSVLLRSTGTGAVVGTVLAGVGLVSRMWGREEIEWKDRAWRLLENRGQVEVDKWSVVGVVLGGMEWVWRTGGVGGGRWRRRIGSLGMGSTAGVLGYMVWRHGVHGGKWEEE